MRQTTSHLPVPTTGVDLSDKISTYVSIDLEGRLAGEGKFPTTLEGVNACFAERSPTRIVLEASTQAFWVARLLGSLGHEVIVANPRRIHLISKSIRKTDRNDAFTLARLGRVDPELLHPVQIRNERCLVVQALLRARKQLVWTRTRLINLVRAECKVHGVPLATCSSEAFVKRARTGVPSILRAAFEPLLETLSSLNTSIRRYDEQVEQLCKSEFPQTRLLRQVRGVGALVALSFVTAIGDPGKFKDSRHVGAYLGLVPRTYQSGSSDPHLRITKQGDRALRSLLVGAAAHIMRRSSPDSTLKRFGCRIANRGNPRDKARGRIAVARKLAVLLHRIWLTGEVYEPLRGATART